MIDASNLNVNKLKAWAREHRSLALTVATAQAFAQVERERVDAYVRPIFLRYGFTNDMDRQRNTRKGETLTDPKQLYLSGDNVRCEAFYAECDVAHREHCQSWDEEPGTCPALVAEMLQIKAESLLLDELAKFMGVADADGTHTFYKLELRAKALTLAMTCALGGVK